MNQNRNRRLLISVALLLLSFTAVSARHSYSLSDCIHRAVTYNISTTINQWNIDIAQLANQGVRYSFLPTLSLSNNHNVSLGRSLDPTTYQFVTNRTVYDMSASIGGSMILFSGFERINNIKKAKLNLQSALLETEKTKNDLALNVTAIFLNIVLDKEVISICESKVEMLRRQEDLIRRKIEAEAAIQGDILNIQAVITQAQVELAEAKKSLNVDKIAMCEIISIEDWAGFDVSMEDIDCEYLESPRAFSQDILVSAYCLPEIRLGENSIDMAKRDIAITASSYYPTLQLNAGYGSTFSNARTKPGGEEYDFYDQLKDNMSSYVTLSLNIPILSSISVANKVKQKHLSLSIAEDKLLQAKLALEKDVKQAIVNANASYEKYILLKTNVEQCIEALRQTEEKYAVGAATYYDYQIAFGNLFQAQAQQLQSKYEYIFRTIIVDFYAGKPLCE